MNSSTSISDRPDVGDTPGPLRFLAAVGVVACIALVALASLKHDPYVRFVGVSGESAHYMRLRWIYERIHFDATPIDVAFIGTSHAQSAINSSLVENELRQRGLDLHVVNFAIPHLGRDLHYLIVRELLESRAVRELVVEVQDFEPRAPHPAFQRLGRVDDLLTSPIFINTGYLDNLLRLPRRQLDLFLPGLSGRAPATFDPRRYEGPHWDDTERLHGFSLSRYGTKTTAYLDGKADEFRAAQASKEAFAAQFVMPDGCNLLKRYDRIYLEKLLILARDRNVHVTFLYLPYFHGPDQPEEARYYAAYGDTLTPRTTLDDPTSWLNVDHLNVFGARKASRWVGQTLSIVQNAPPRARVEAPCY